MKKKKHKNLDFLNKMKKKNRKKKDQILNRLNKRPEVD
jgi:hypothetical protein